jgi:hypothetical protein
MLSVFMGKRGPKPSEVKKVAYFKRVTPEQKEALDRALLEAKVDQHILGEHLRRLDRQGAIMKRENGVELKDSAEVVRLRAENERLKAKIAEYEQMYG